MKAKIKKRVIIIGGGYAGISILHALKKQKNLQLTLIDKSKEHLLQTHIHKYLSGYYTKKDITFNHQEYCTNNNIEFMNDEVLDINYKENYLLTRENHLHHYDYIVVATGSISIFPKQIENILEFTKDIKEINNLDFYRSQFLQLLATKPKNKNIVVVGGGVSGLQIACEYAQTIKSNHLHVEDIAVTLVEGLDTILPGMDRFLIQKAEERCAELGIKTITNLFASKIFKDKVILSNGNEISYDMLLFVIGAMGNSLQNSNKDILENQRKQLIVDEYYLLNPYNNAFAMGDIVEATDIVTNTFQAPTAQAARMQATLIAKNISNSINNKKLVKNNVSIKGILIDLGGSNCAIGKLFSFNLSGKIALWIKKIIYALHAKKLS